jgi:predicted Zn-dependent peptidase
MKKIILLVLFALCLSSQNIYAQIKTFKLSNNIKVVFEKTDNANVVSVKVFTPIASISENETNAGITHLLVNAMCVSTLDRSRERLSEDLDDLGTYIYADTKSQYSFIGADFMSQYLDEALSVLADVIINPAFNNKEIIPLKENILTELALRKDRISIVAIDKISNEYYKGSPLAYPSIGTAKTINAINTEEIKSWHKYAFNSQNIIISVAGNISMRALKKSLEEHFSKMESGKKYEKPAIELSNTRDGTVRSKDKFHQSLLSIICKSPDLNSDDLAAFNVLTDILGDGLNGRLAKEVRVNSGLTYNISMFHSLMTDNNISIIMSSMEPKNISIALQKINVILDEITKSKADISELERVKTKIRSSYLLENQTVSNKSFNNGWGDTVAGDFNYRENLIKGIEKVSLEDIIRVAEKYLTQKPLIVIID